MAIGKPTHPSKLGPIVKVRRGGLGRSNAGEHAAVSKRDPRTPPYERQTTTPRWARKYEEAS
jgi:hypothetical protein